ncbi:MAG: hypothetical protein ORN57_01075 [Alphaproteobacteria bacterium]|nr:hypothetical protein [Alphaproteobacteria bacterium]
MLGIDGLQAANYFYISFFAWVVLLPLGIVVGVGLAFYLTKKYYCCC